MATAKKTSVDLTLTGEEAQFLTDLLFHHVSFDNNYATTIYSALAGSGFLESDLAPFGPDNFIGEEE